MQRSKFILTIFLLSTVTLSYAQPTYSKKVIDSTCAFTCWPRNVEVGHLNNDTFEDIVLSADDSQIIMWYENDGTGNYTPHPLDNSGAHGIPFDSKIIDFDGDGDMDVVAANTYIICWYENDGNGVFTYRFIDDPISNSYIIAAGDFDKDGNMDIVAGNSNVNSSYVLFTDSAGAIDFGKGYASIYYEEPNDIRVIDVDKDGNLDYVVAAGSYGGATGMIIWEKGDGNGGFTRMTIDSSTFSAEASSVFVVDLDGDTYNDILATSRTADLLIWYKNTGSNTFVSNIVDNTLSRTNGAKSVWAEDMNGDGKQDILLASESAGYHLYLNNGAGGFSNQVLETAPGGLPDAIRASDSNADGQPDIIGTTWLPSSVTNNKLIRYQACNLNITTNVDTTICEGQSAVLFASGATTYSWNQSAGSGSSVTVSPTVSTSYVVTGTQDGCSATDTVSVEVLNCTGINKSGDFSNLIKMYPNPVHELLFIEPASNINLQKIQVLDMTGQICLTKTAMGTKRVQLQLGCLSTGVYCVQFTTNEGVVYRSRIIR